MSNKSGLNKHKFSKIKQEYHDINEYAFKLNSEAEDWLNRFMEEDLGARLNHDGKKIYKKKKDKTETFRRNNQRNRDLYSLARVTNRLITDGNTDVSIEQQQSTKNPEECLIQLLDEGQNKRKILTKDEFLKFRKQIKDNQIIEFYEKYYNLKPSI